VKALKYDQDYRSFTAAANVRPTLEGFYCCQKISTIELHTQLGADKATYINGSNVRIGRGVFLMLAIIEATDPRLYSDSWLKPLGSLVVMVASGIWIIRFIFPWVVVSWDKDAIASRSNSWLHPFSPTQKKILWDEISKVKVRRSGAIVLIGGDNHTQVFWSDSFGGYSFLTEYLRKRRPDLFL